MSKSISYVLCSILLATNAVLHSMSHAAPTGETHPAVTIVFDEAEPAIAFAARDLHSLLKEKAIPVHMEQALHHWQAYGRILDSQYIKMNIAIHRVFDWDALAADVREDINIARNAE